MSSPETWLAARLAAGMPAETWKPVPQDRRLRLHRVRGRPTPAAPGPSTASAVTGAPCRAARCSTRAGKDDGYVRLDMRCDNPACKRPHTFTMQKVVLNTFDGARRRGMEASHLQGNPAWNWFPEAAGVGRPAGERGPQGEPAPAAGPDPPVQERPRLPEPGHPRGAPLPGLRG